MGEANVMKWRRFGLEKSMQQMLAQVPCSPNYQHILLTHFPDTLPLSSEEFSSVGNPASLNEFAGDLCKHGLSICKIGVISTK